MDDKPVEIHLAIRKPKQKEFFRVCGDRNYQITMMTYLRKVEGSFDEEYWSVLPGPTESYLENLEEGKLIQLVLCVSDRGVYFFWPLPVTEGTERPVTKTARECARMALTQWIRIKYLKSDATYHPYVKKDQSQVPTWPDPEKEPLSVLLKRAFGKRIIDSPEHPVLLKDLEGDDGKPKERKDGEGSSTDWL